MKNFTLQRWRFSFILFFFLSVGSVFAQTPYESLNYLYSISGSQTVAGQHNREPNSDPSRWTREIYSITGVYPGLWGGDFLFSGDDINNRQMMINQAITEWNNGSLVAIMWHTCSPLIAEPCDWNGGLLGNHLNDSQWNELITNGTYLNNVWKQRMDDIAYYLQQLEDAGVEVLFRPLHEMNQGAFWWGGRPGPEGSSRLYQITHDYLTYEKGLNNLIWVWNVQDFGSMASDLNSYDPGGSYWDVLTMDMYWSDGTGYAQWKYDAIRNKANGKPIAIGEMDQLPTPALLQSQPDWAYFMGWAELVFQENSAQQIQETYWAGNVTTQNEMPGWDNNPEPPEPLTENIAYMKPVTVSSAESAALSGANAVDGNGATRWASAYADNQSFVIDLGSTYDLNRVVLNWETAYAGAYQVQVSNDNLNWTTVYETWSGNGGTDEINFTASGRYVKMYGISRATAYGFSLWEFEVYGTGGTAPPPPPPSYENIAYMKPVTVSSAESAAFSGANAVDANGTTRWASAYVDNQNFIIDLQGTYNISRVVLNWEAAYGSAYQIQVSNDNVSWTTVYETWSGEGGMEEILFSSPGRYVKLYGITRATPYGFSLWEIGVYGSLSSSSQAGITEGGLKFKGVETEQSALIPWPNPFSEEVNIPVFLSEPGAVSVQIFNATGQLLRELSFDQLEPGVHQIEWNGESESGASLKGGIYLYKVQVPGNIQKGRLLKIK